MIKLVVFDLDDTLYPERQYIVGGFRAVADYLKKRLKSDYDFFPLLQDAFDAGVRGNTFNHVLEQAGIEADEHLVQKLVDVYREHEPTIRPHDDVIPALEALKGKCRLGLISDGPLVSQRRKWDALGIAHFFDKVIFTDEMGREFWKPNPWAFREMTAHFDLQPEECVYAADNPQKDFIGPHEVGWRAIGIRRQGAIHTNPGSEQHQPDIWIESFSELGPCIEG